MAKNVILYSHVALCVFLQLVYNQNYCPVNSSQSWPVFRILENSKQDGILYDVRARMGKRFLTFRILENRRNT